MFNAEFVPHSTSFATFILRIRLMVTHVVSFMLNYDLNASKLKLLQLFCFCYGCSLIPTQNSKYAITVGCFDSIQFSSIEISWMVHCIMKPLVICNLKKEWWSNCLRGFQQMHFAFWPWEYFAQHFAFSLAFDLNTFVTQFHCIKCIWNWECGLIRSQIRPFIQHTLMLWDFWKMFICYGLSSKANV